MSKKGKKIFMSGGKNIALGKRGPRKSMYDHSFRQAQLDHTRKILKVRRDNGWWRTRWKRFKD